MKTEPPLCPHPARNYSLTARFGGSVRATGHPRINYAQNYPQNFSPLLSRTHAARRNYHHDSIPEQQAGCAILRRCRWHRWKRSLDCRSLINRGSMPQHKNLPRPPPLLSNLHIVAFGGAQILHQRRRWANPTASLQFNWFSYTACAIGAEITACVPARILWCIGDLPILIQGKHYVVLSTSFH
jgi:hypothetical protein